MIENDNVISIETPVNPLGQLLKSGAQWLLGQAIEAELAALARMRLSRDFRGSSRMVTSLNVRSKQSLVILMSKYLK